MNPELNSTPGREPPQSRLIPSGRTLYDEIYGFIDFAQHGHCPSSPDRGTPRDLESPRYAPWMLETARKAISEGVREYGEKFARQFEQEVDRKINVEE